jgi:hypothetical protein
VQEINRMGQPGLVSPTVLSAPLGAHDHHQRHLIGKVLERPAPFAKDRPVSRIDAAHTPKKVPGSKASEEKEAAVSVHGPLLINAREGDNVGHGYFLAIRVRAGTDRRKAD